MLHLPIVLTLAAAATAQSYVGCYHHEYNTMLLTDNMMWFGNEWAGLLTPDLCFDHCSGYNYFGLVGGNQCACGNDLPADEYKQDETYCDVPCVGDSDVPCGGPDNTINIYEADGAASTTESIIGSTMEPTVPTTEDVVTYSSVTMPEATTTPCAPATECGADISDDCQAGYDNAVANGNLEDFYCFCGTEGGATPLRDRCSLCCGGSGSGDYISGDYISGDFYGSGVY